MLPDTVREGPQPEEIPLDILYEDAWLAAINKPPAMVVHPGKGNWSGTLTSALQFHFDTLSDVGGPTRPGIVHRLDRDTSGVIVWPRTIRRTCGWPPNSKSGTVEKEYFAIVAGQPNLDRDWIDLPIGLHPQHRERMAIRRDDPASRPAQSFTKWWNASTVLPACVFCRDRRHASDSRSPGEYWLQSAIGSMAAAPATRGELRRRPEQDTAALFSGRPCMRGV